MWKNSKVLAIYTYPWTMQIEAKLNIQKYYKGYINYYNV